MGSRDIAVQAQMVVQRQVGAFNFQAVNMSGGYVVCAVFVGDRIDREILEVLVIVVIGGGIDDQRIVEKAVLRADLERVDVLGLEGGRDQDGAGVVVDAARLVATREAHIFHAPRRQIVLQLGLTGRHPFRVGVIGRNAIGRARAAVMVVVITSAQSEAPVRGEVDRGLRIAGIGQPVDVPVIVV